MDSANKIRVGEICISIEKDNDNNNNNNEEAKIRIQDTGIGIDSEVLPRLFEKFASKSERGTGLGLYISKVLCKLMVERYGRK